MKLWSKCSSKCVVVFMGVWILASVTVLKLDSMAKQSLGFGLMPFALIGAGCLALLLYLARTTQSKHRKLAYSYLTIIPLCLIVGEIYAYYKLESTSTHDPCDASTSGTYASDYFTPSAITGYKGKPRTTATAHKATQSGEEIYNVSYTTDASGWRITPSSKRDSRHCVLFFGDSFTIGEGLNDNESLPFYFGTHTNARIYNFGFHGYGPHQALALLRSGEVQRIVQDCDSVLAIYESLPGHIARANGFSPWEQGTSAPRFALQSDGTLQWRNAFLHTTPLLATLAPKLQARLAQSYLYKLLQPIYRYDDSYNALYFAIVENLQAELRKQFNAKLVLLLWDSTRLSDALESQESSAIIAHYKTARGGGETMNLLLVSDILPGYNDARASYAIHTCDLHPNAKANDKIARYLSAHLER